jgi:peptidyl-dipeptidase Dcp
MSAATPLPPAATALPATNPFAAESTLPLRYPPFDRIRDEDFAPAFEAGMAGQLEEVERIAANPAAPTFENTLVALERSGRILDRAMTVFHALVAADTNDTRNRLRSEYAPRFAAHSDAIFLDARLFARIDALHARRAELGLDAEGERLVQRYHQDFVRAGARLPAADKARLSAMNTELAALASEFTQKVLDEVNADAVIVDDVAELDGLTPAQIATAAAEARTRGFEGRYALTLLNTTGQPLASQLTSRALRQRLHAASEARNSHGGPNDTCGTVQRTMQLRAERARLLGYPDHATYVLEDQTARGPQAVDRMLSALVPAAIASAKHEAAQLQALVDEDGGGFRLASWDWSYYAEKLRRRKFDFDEAGLAPYLELRSVFENGVFYAATRLYGLQFRQRTDLPVYHPDVWTWDILDGDGSLLAILILDVYARPSKHGGAWMNAYVSQSRLLGQRAVVANHLNIVKPPPGEPTLLTWDEVTTAFHEFGHALHGLFSDVAYPYFSGTNVPRDFVEFPSQVNEMWAEWPEVLRHYARHHRTGEPLPQELLDKVIAASKFNQGFATTEYLAATLVDQRWHRLAPEQVPAAADVRGFESRSLAADGIDFAPVPPRYRTPYFSHSLGGYAAGYYAYIWAEVLDANSQAWFARSGGLTRENGDRFRRCVLSRGGSAESMALYRDFAGAEPDIGPLLDKRGLRSALP